MSMLTRSPEARPARLEPAALGGRAWLDPRSPFPAPSARCSCCWAHAFLAVLRRRPQACGKSPWGAPPHASGGRGGAAQSGRGGGEGEASSRLCGKAGEGDDPASATRSRVAQGKGLAKSRNSGPCEGPACSQRTAPAAARYSCPSAWPSLPCLALPLPLLLPPPCPCSCPCSCCGGWKEVPLAVRLVAAQWEAECAPGSSAREEGAL